MLYTTDILAKADILVNGDNSMPNRVRQDVYLIEEMAELTQALMKDRRGKGDLETIKDEIADVLTTALTYMIDKEIYIHDIEQIINKKLERAISRLKEGEQ